MNYTFVIQNDILIVTIDGRFVASNTDDFEQQIQMHGKGINNILFDLSNMTHIDSTALGVLVKLLQEALNRNGSVKLACIQQKPRIIFEITRVYRVFEIYDTVDEALASFQPPAQEPGLVD